MIKDIFQIIIALILLFGLVFILLRFVKYRRTNTYLLINLFNNLSIGKNSGKRNIAMKNEEDINSR